MESPAASLPLTAWTTWLVRVLWQKGNWLIKTGWSVCAVGGECLVSKFYRNHPMMPFKEKLFPNHLSGISHWTTFGFSVFSKITWAVNHNLGIETIPSNTIGIVFYSLYSILHVQLCYVSSHFEQRCHFIPGDSAVIAGMSEQYGGSLGWRVGALYVLCSWQSCGITTARRRSTGGSNTSPPALCCMLLL